MSPTEFETWIQGWVSTQTFRWFWKNGFQRVEIKVKSEIVLESHHHIRFPWFLNILRWVEMNAQTWQLTMVRRITYKTGGWHIQEAGDDSNNHFTSDRSREDYLRFKDEQTLASYLLLTNSIFFLYAGTIIQKC